MKAKLILLFSAIAIVFIVYSLIDNSAMNASASTLAWQTYDRGIEQAATLNKKILLDVYTDWCSWCKKMDKEVYVDETVTTLLKEKFIVVKLNAESSKTLTHDGIVYTEQQFATALGITGYPTTVFFEPNTKPITLVSGYMEPATFTNVLRFIGEDHYKSISYEEYLQKAGQSR